MAATLIIITDSIPPIESRKLPKNPVGDAKVLDNLNNKIKIKEKIMSVINTSSKVYKPKTYKEMVSDFVCARQGKEVIEGEI